MSRIVRLATCQPPTPVAHRTQDQIETAALALLDRAGDMGADIVCLPECLNVVGLDQERATAELDGSSRRLRHRVSEACERYGMYCVLPLIQREDGSLRNAAFIFGRQGQLVGRYHKVHLTRPEREDWGLSPGGDYPVFDLDFGRIGVMICYDGCFPEPARILALQGAEVVLFPSLQRGYTETELDLQVRSRAWDNFIHVVRSSYGTPAAEAWRPGVMVGKSCIVGPDGTVLADLGRHCGVVMREVDLDAPQLGERTFGGEVGIVRDMRMADRRPDTYAGLCDGPAPPGDE